MLEVAFVVLTFFAAIENGDIPPNEAGRAAYEQKE